MRINQRATKRSLLIIPGVFLVVVGLLLGICVLIGITTQSEVLKTLSQTDPVAAYILVVLIFTGSLGFWIIEFLDLDKIFKEYLKERIIALVFMAVIMFSLPYFPKYAAFRGWEKNLLTVYGITMVVYAGILLVADLSSWGDTQQSEQE